MSDQAQSRLQFVVFALVSASFTNIYICQPVLPVLQREFAADMVLVSLSVSSVILGIALGLLGICAGFFTVHSAAIGGLNRRLTGAQGRANALYVLFYYLGGWLGITCSGIAFEEGGWRAVVYLWGLLLLIPIISGMGERKADAGLTACLPQPGRRKGDS